MRELEEISRRTGVPNPYTQSLGVIQQLIRTLSSIPLSENIDDYININDYLFEEQPLIETPFLPVQPMPNASIITPQLPGATALQQGLTPTEVALLGPAEQQIRLKQRGLA